MSRSLRALLSFAVCVLALSARAQIVQTTIETGAVTCTGLGQFCGTTYELDVTTGGVLDVSFESSEGVCSAFTLTAYVDGHEFGTTTAGYLNERGRPSDYPPATKVVNLKNISAGTHRLSFQATGLEGGCNAGMLHGWSGTLTIRTSNSTCGEADVALADIERILGATIAGTGSTARVATLANAISALRRSTRRDLASGLGASLQLPAVSTDCATVETSLAPIEQALGASLPGSNTAERLASLVRAIEQAKGSTQRALANQLGAR